MNLTTLLEEDSDVENLHYVILNRDMLFFL